MKTTFKFSDTNIAKWNPPTNKKFDMLFDTKQECLVCIVQTSGIKTFAYRYKDQNKKIKQKKLFRFIEHSPTNNVDEARFKIQEWQQSRRDGNSIQTDNEKTVESLANRFLKEALDGWRISYLTGKSPLMVKYEDKTKREIKTYIKCYILLKTKDQDLKLSLTRPLKQDHKLFKDIELDKVSKEDVEDIMVRLSQSPYAANRLKAWLSAMFEWGIYKKICKTNPTERVGKNLEQKIKTYLDEPTVKRVYNYINSKLSINAHFKIMVGLSHDTGIRLIHIFGLLWEQPKTQKEKDESRGWIDFANNKIRIHRGKDKKEFNFDLADDGRAWLEKLRELLYTPKYSWALKSKWVFPKPRSKEDKPYDYDSYKASLKKMIEYLGLPKDFKLKFARKTYVTNIGRKYGIDIASRKAGHSNTKTTKEHYYTPDDDDLKIKSSYGETKNDVVELKAINGNG